MRARSGWGIPIVLLLASGAPRVALAQQEKSGQSLGEVARFAGSYGDKVDIAVPPFHGIEPSLALEYDSSRGNGFAGVGWALAGVDYVQRPHQSLYENNALGGDPIVQCDTQSLSPSCNFTNVPTSLDAGDPPPDGGLSDPPTEDPTAPDSTDATPQALSYATRHETFVKIRRDPTPTTDTWMVWDKDGVKKVYGGPGHLFSDYGSVFRWYLASKTDRHGNMVYYDWTCETQPGFNGDQINADCYPSAIRYRNVTISILRETRPDTILFATGQPVHGGCTSCGNLQIMLGRTTKRLKYVIVKVNDGTGDKVFRAYVLTYKTFVDEPTATRRSVIGTVLEYGTDTTLKADGTPNTAGASALPTRSFSYTGATQPTLTTAISSGTVNGIYCAANGGPLLSGDFDGDKCADLIDRSPTGSFFPRVFLSNCDGTFKPPVLIAVPYWNLDASRWRFGDFNGDGKTDLAVLTSLGSSEPVRIYLSQGRDPVTDNFKGWTYVPGFNHTIDGSTNQYLRQADLARYQNGDFDGDGLTDFAVTQGQCTAVYPTPCTDTKPIDIVLARIVNGSLTWVHTNGPTHSVTYGLDGDPLYSVRRIKYADFNGDGRTDVAVIEGDDTQAGGIARPAVPMSIYQSGLEPAGASFTGGFTAFPTRGPAIPYRRQPFIVSAGNIQDDQRVRFGDFNGDGMTDIMVVHGNSPPFESTLANVTVHLSHGADGFFAAPITGPQIYIYNNEYSFFDPGWVPLGDYNGDGRTDIGFNTGIGSNANVYLSEGFSSTSINFSNSIGAASGYRFDCGLTADVNGDGKDDLIDTQSSPVQVYLSSGSPPDLLSTATNGQGGKITVTYTPSSRWKNVDGPPLQQTVDSTTVEDGRGQSAHTTFRYDGGRFDKTQRRFLGFRSVTAGLPLTASDGVVQPFKRTWFVQDYRAPTSLIDKEQLFRSDPDLGGVLLREEQHEYYLGGLGAQGGVCDGDQTDDVAPFVALQTGITTTDYDGSGNACPNPWAAGSLCAYGRRTRSEMQYDVINPNLACVADGRLRLRLGFGNLTEQRSYGDWDAADGEENTVDYVFPSVPNGDYYVVGKPVRKVTTSGTSPGGAILEQENYFYDGTTPGDGSTGWDSTPQKGDLTAKAQWLNLPVSKYVVEKYEFDSYGNKTRVYDALGNPTTTTYDSDDHVIVASQINALNQTVTFGNLDRVCGLARTATDPNGGVTNNSFDAFCRPARIDHPGGRFDLFTYAFSATNPESQYVRTESPGPNATNLYVQKHFDGLGREWKVRRSGPTTSQEIVTTTGYDARGNVETTTDARYANETAQTTTRTYDAWGRLTRGQHPDGSVVTVAYADRNGTSTTTRTDEEGHAVADVFNGFGKVTQHFEPRAGGGTIETQYMNFPQRTETYDASMTRFVSQRDSLGRVIQEQHPDRGVWTYEYYDNGPLLRVTDAMSPGQITEFAYDAIQRKTSKTTRKGAAGQAIVTWSYDQPRTGYFNVGRLTRTTDITGSETFDFDLAGRPVNKVRTIGGTSYTFQSGFDLGDRLLWRTFPDGDVLGTVGNPILYDDGGRVVSLPGYVSGVQWTAWGKPLSWYDLNNTTAVRTFDPARHWLNTSHVEKPPSQSCQLYAPHRNMCMIDTPCPDDPICYPNSEVCCQAIPALVVQDLVYQHDHEGKITRVDSLAYRGGWTYDYTPNHWLQGAHSLSSSAYDQILTYSDTGNVVTNSLRTGSYVYQSPSNSGGWRSHAVSAVGSDAYGYDRNGNQISRPGQVITWGGDNLPTRVSPPGTYVGALDLEYDADGRRIRKTRWLTTNSTEVTVYPEEDYEIVGSETTKYFHLGDVLVAKKKGGQAFWLATDVLGTLQSITGPTGDPVWNQSYSPEGDRNVLGYPHTETRGFTGEREDESGLMQIGARSYDPALANFISPDPTIPDHRVVSLNPYAYAGNDPINRIDPTGFRDAEIERRRPDEDHAQEFATAAADATRTASPATNGNQPVATVVDKNGIPIYIFSIPKEPGAGTVRVELFIATKSALVLKGDNRGFDNGPNDDNSRAIFSLNFDQGVGSMKVNPSSLANGSDKTAPLPLGKGNELVVTAGGDSVSIGAGLKNSVIGGPSINLNFTVKATQDSVTFKGVRNSYPSLEVTRNGQTCDGCRVKEGTPLNLFDIVPKSTFQGGFARH
ncbi:MAG TPA: FG-GAP-like repeat-containing protein [Candidatus Polarisedimenticolaceae bacterium]|nr:FG-GAP-like repeat-containing protein [Candidatus Polarisedimenticolaceae bacterium]